MFNVDNLPFYIVCPEADIELFNKSLRAGEEKYKLVILSDEEVLKANGLEAQKQSWQVQQLIKLGFYKLGLCNHYAIFDSDCYFIQNFHFDDFMYDESTPYFYMKELLANAEDRRFAKDYLGRKGKIYSFIYNSQVFSLNVLRNMDEGFLQKKGLTIKSLIDMYPYEFQWYGEWFLLSQIYPLYPTSGKVKVYWLEQQYVDDRKKGIRVEDLIAEGYFAILLNNGWVKAKIYKNPLLGKFSRSRRNIFALTHERKKRKLNFYLKLPFLMFKEFINA